MKQHKFLKITISLILLIALITAASIFLSYNVLKVRTFSYETDKAVDPVRAVVISDLHEHEFGKDNVKLVEKIREQEPDIILMVGDFVNQDSTESTVVVKLVEQLSKLAPVCYSLGNHEESYMAKTDWNFPTEIEKAGAHFLDKEYVDTEVNGQQLRIGGIYGYCLPARYLETNEADPEECAFLSEFQDTDRYTVLLTHMPVCWLINDGINEWDIDCVFSGHVHGGEVILPFIGGMYAPDFGWFPGKLEGVYTSDDGTKNLVLSRGLGTTEVIPRFNNIPEIVVVDLM